MKFTSKSIDSEALGISALVYLAADTERLETFLNLAGIAASDIRAAAAEPGFLGAVLDHLLNNEKLLTEFAASEGLDPASVAPARARLPGAWMPSDFG